MFIREGTFIRDKDVYQTRGRLSETGQLSETVLLESRTFIRDGHVIRDGYVYQRRGNLSGTGDRTTRMVDSNLRITLGTYSIKTRTGL